MREGPDSRRVQTRAPERDAVRSGDPGEAALLASPRHGEAMLSMAGGEESRRRCQTRDVDRRTLLAGGAALLAGLASGGPARADKPAVHKLALGGVQVTVLSDGHMTVPATLLSRAEPPTELLALLARHKLGPERLDFALNVALVRLGTEVVLIDAGAGANWEPTAGRLPQSLEAAGIAPESITRVVITHAHPDHLWGLVDELDDSPRFAKAEHIITAVEHDFWALAGVAEAAGVNEGMALGARRTLKAIAPKLRRVKAGGEVLPGLTLIDTAGHTPGHVSVLIGKGSDRLLVTADAVHHAVSSFEHPDWQPRADMDAAGAVASRHRLVDMAAAERLITLAYHLPFPGLGRVERKGTGYRWLAAA